MNTTTVLQAIQTYAIQTPQALAVADGTGSLSYGAYWRKICAAATYLKHLGTQQGECVAVKAEQSMAYLALCHGIQLAGAIPVPLEKSVNEGRLIEIMQETKARLLFSDAPIADYDCHAIAEAFCFQADETIWDLPPADADAMILFTTGTTGKSKGVVIQYRAEFAVAENVKYGVEMRQDNVELIPMPMNHSFSLRRYFANMINGSSVVITDGVFFVKILFEMMDRHHVTALALAPAALGIILKLTRGKLSQYSEQLDYIQLGTAPLPEADKAQLLSLLPNIRLYNIYGSTEFGCACVLNFNSSDNQPNCIGYPAKNAIFKIVDETGTELPTASLENPGFLSYTGAMGMKEYLHDPASTKAALMGEYLRSSDLGYRDAQGRIYMLGRADDVIMAGGNKVSPFEVEDVAKRYEGVHDCICKGKKDPLMGAVPVLYIVASNDLDIAKLDAHMTHWLEDFKRPRQIMQIESVPRTYNGKIDRKAEIEEMKGEKVTS